eukprot:6093988-Pleurochrysis_carterae.AAC.3
MKAALTISGPVWVITPSTSFQGTFHRVIPNAEFGLSRVAVAQSCPILAMKRLLRRATSTSMSSMNILFAAWAFSTCAFKTS